MDYLDCNNSQSTVVDLATVALKLSIFIQIFVFLSFSTEKNPHKLTYLA